MAKLLNVFGDENPNLQRQNGCMSGIFQMFDRRCHLLTQGRHGGHIIQQKQLHSGNVVSRSRNDNQRNSIESSMPSFSSSSCSSSFSSLECNKSTLTTQHEDFPVVQKTTIKEKPLRNSQKSLNSRRDGSLIVTTSMTHPSFGQHQSIDFRDIVKESINRDSPRLVSSQAKMNYGDSPKLVSVSRLKDRSFAEKYGKLRTCSEEKQNDVFFSVPKEAHRFSCDSNIKSESKLKDLPRLSLDFERNPSNVVAKLMGLEASPNMSSGSPHHDLRRSTVCTDSSIKNVRERKQDRSLSSLKNSNKDDTNTRVQMEIAPLRWQEKINSSQKMAGFRTTETPVSRKHDSVCYEISKKLEELEFLQSNKDFRALKQILDTIQAKRILKTEKPGKDHQQKHGLEKEKSCKCKSPASKSINQLTERYVESPIVIMKPTNSIRRCGNGGHSSTDTVTPLASPVKLRKVRTCEDPTDGKTGLLPNQRQDKEKTPKCSPKASLTHIQASGQNKKSQASTSPRTPLKTSGSSSSPRLQHRKHELEKKSQSNCVSSSPDLSKPQKQSKHQPTSETLSHKRKHKMKPKKVALNDQDGGSLNRKYRSSSYLSHQESDISNDQSHRALAKLKVLCQSSGSGNINDKALIIELKKSTVVKLDASTVSEQPSPISVLDASLHKDDPPSSPVNELSCSFKDQKTINTNYRNPENSENSEILVEKKSQLISSKQKECAWVNHINRLHEPNDPNHIYIAEIVHASGFQFQDFRFHDFNHVIDPNLFLLLEKRKTDSIASPESISDNFPRLKAKRERLWRKVLFDTVDEVLIQKLGLGKSNHPHPKSIIPSSCCNLPQGLWLEIKKLQADDECMQQEARKSNDDDSDNILKLILNQDVMYRSKEWNNFESEVSMLVHDIESLIFQNLIGEISSSEPVHKKRQTRSAERYLYQYK